MVTSEELMAKEIMNGKTYLHQFREFLDGILIKVPHGIGEINFKDDVKKPELLHLFHADGNGFLVGDLIG